MARKKPLPKYQGWNTSETSEWNKTDPVTGQIIENSDDIFVGSEIAGNVPRPFPSIDPVTGEIIDVNEISPDRDINYDIELDMIKQGKRRPASYRSDIRREGGQILDSFKSAARFDQKSYKKNPGRRNKG